MIGKRPTSGTMLKVNSSLIWETGFTNLSTFSDRGLMITPFYGTMLGDYVTKYTSKQVGLASVFMDPNARKLFTMYKQVRVKGMYVTITPMMLPSDMQYVTIYGCWERKARTGVENTSTVYAGLTTDAGMLACLEDCMAQGGKRITFAADKGRTAVRYKCIPRGGEKYAWTDTTVTWDTWDGTSTWSSFKYHEFYVNRLWEAGADKTYVNFNPMLFLVFQSQYPVSTTANMSFRIDVSYYLTFREPGTSQKTTIKEMLLLPNEFLKPWLKSGDMPWPARPSLPSKDRKDEEEEDEDDQPEMPTKKAKREEEIHDTQVLDESTLI